MFPILISMTMARDGKKIKVNANHIEEIVQSPDVNNDTDDFDSLDEKDIGGTLVFLHGRAFRVKETPEQIAVEIKAATNNVITDIVNRLHAMGFIH